MALYQKVDTSMDFVGREREVEDFWKKNDIFEKSIKEHEGDPSYVFYDGPPTANGKPHIGHVLTRCIKDLIPRYQTMKGKMVPRKAGWDTHGLPVELEVEKQIGINGKDQIESYGIAPFIELCKENVWKYKGMWEDFSFKVGFWADMEDPYVTYYNDYIESEWWALKEIWNKGLLYKGFKIVPYCPRCGTPLSSHEVAQGYKVVKERSAIVRFKAKDEDLYYLAWTTTPWTLTSNIGLCVNPDEEYVKVKDNKDGYTYILARALCDRVLGEGEYEVLESYKGSELEHREYEPLYPDAAAMAEKQHKKGFYLVCDGYVSMDDGTGIVHIAPAFGEDDARIGRKYDSPFVQLVDEKGNMTAEGPWKGVFVKKADPMILKDLEERGQLFDAPVFEHSYPHCWRCGTPLLYYARESWYIKMSAVRDDLIRNNNTINWVPESIGKGRFGDWIANVQDWALSRNRYWGTPLPIWECECGERTCIGSNAELKEKSPNYEEVLAGLKAAGDKGYEGDIIELHRPYIDQVEVTCPKCGKPMYRVLEVIDCWFDSGAMPFAQHHYPFENKELFEKEFPAQFISEAVDQTRGWFYSLLAESTLLFNKAPYENVIVLGHVQDENGQKMSKSKGNAVDPMEALSEFGADAIRWYFYTNSAPWLPNRFYGKAVTEGQRKVLGTLWNTYAFYILYANIDNFDPTGYKLDTASLSVMDRWILSKMNSMIKDVDQNLSQYKIPEACKALEVFIDDLSNWYVRRSRERFWAKGMEQDKINAYMTLYTSLYNVSLCAAPFIPFMTEEIYQNMVRSVDKEAPESIHLCDFPKADESMIDGELEQSMDEVLRVVILGRAARNASGLKNRQPIGRMFVKAEKPLSGIYADIIKDELNLKAVEMRDDVREFTSYTFKPQLKTVGPRYGKNLGFIKQYLTDINGNEAMNELNDKGVLAFTAPDGTDIELTKDDLLIDVSKQGGYVTEEDRDITVVLDTNLSEELINEGFMREIISKVQTMRKEAGFEVMDHITIGITGSDRIMKIADMFKETICHDCMAEGITSGTLSGYRKEWDINGEKAELSVEKLS
ncbi:MAG TPA: isoleucine--tRNA ligase [Candidatus Avilachnospira avicola]|nr:isoleucine--tRNA ligase [Candidatus Avilachnospira avicola]